MKSEAECLAYREKCLKETELNDGKNADLWFVNYVMAAALDWVLEDSDRPMREVRMKRKRRLK
jgi:hypothetical protein